MEETVKLENPKNQLSKENINTLRLSINTLKAEKNARLLNLIYQNPIIAGVLLYLIFLPSLWGLIFRLRPLWLLRINDTIKQHEYKLPDSMGGIKLPLRDIIFLGFFTYRPRVLNAWVQAHIETVRAEFAKIETVKERATYIPVPVKLDGNNFSKNDWQSNKLQASLQKIFNRERACLLIWGEGGAGKTSIACEIAKWAIDESENKRICNHLMIPILIEKELNLQEENTEHILEKNISLQLQDLTKKAEEISEELLEKLLKHRRILVILDHISEMSEATRLQIEKEAVKYNALLITSRIEETMTNRAIDGTIQPLRIQGADIAVFLQDYLKQQGKLHLFPGKNFYDTCGDLAKLLEEIERQNRLTTVLFAKLYADVLIVNKEGNKDGETPENIPDLMLEYINQLNRDIKENKLEDRNIQQDIKILAWECLSHNYRPTSIKRQDALNALASINNDDTELRLKYLAEKLRLIQIIGADKDSIRFVLDPVSEYLAGLYLLDMYNNDENKWLDFLITADSQSGAPDSIKGFLLAIRDDYLAKIPDAKESDFLPKEIADRCGIGNLP